jgi:hypothetical protein
VDSWAVGVLTFELLVGCPPFYDQSRTNTEARIKSSVPALPATLTEGARNFVCEGERPPMRHGVNEQGSLRRRLQPPRGTGSGSRAWLESIVSARRRVQPAGGNAQGLAYVHAQAEAVWTAMHTRRADGF